jgi:hypothetical protein
MELTAMQALANRPSASLQVQEWSILKNELSKPTFEPSSLGTAWAKCFLVAVMQRFKPFEELQIQ